MLGMISWNPLQGAQPYIHKKKTFSSFALSCCVPVSSIWYHKSTKPATVTLYILTQHRYSSSRTSSFFVCARDEPSFFLCECVPSKDLTASIGTINTKCGTISALFLLDALSAAAVYVSPRPASSLCVVATIVQQQPHFKVFPL